MEQGPREQTRMQIVTFLFQIPLEPYCLFLKLHVLITMVWLASSTASKHCEV